MAAGASETTVNEVKKAHAAKELLETVNEHEVAESPLMTVCIPVAIDSESPERLRELLENVKKRQEEFGENMQIIMWANAQSNESAPSVQTRENYETLRRLASEFSHPGMHIETALDIIPPEEFSMSKLRQRTMDAFVGLALENEYEAGHVITWLDADAVTLGKDYFGKLYDETHEDEIGFVHPQTNYAADWAKGKNKDTYDDATRAFLANEIINRAERGEQEVDAYEYTEESGLTFTYFTFLLSGGCDTSNPVDESEGMINGVRSSLELPIGESLRVGDGNRRGLTVSTPLDREVSMVHAALSGRRIYNNIKQYGVAGMPSDRLGGAVGGDYQLFTHGEPAEHEVADQKAIRDYLEHRRQGLKSKLARDSIARVLKNLYHQ